MAMMMTHTSTTPRKAPTTPPRIAAKVELSVAVEDGEEGEGGNEGGRGREDMRGAAQGIVCTPEVDSGGDGDGDG